MGYIEDDEFTGTVNGGYNALITGGDGNDKIISRGDFVTIDGGEGNDVIRNGFYQKFDYDYYDEYERTRKSRAMITLPILTPARVMIPFTVMRTMFYSFNRWL